MHGVANLTSTAFEWPTGLPDLSLSHTFFSFEMGSNLPDSIRREVKCREVEAPSGKKWLSFARETPSFEQGVAR